MLVSDFDYHLPEELIAQEPLFARDLSRLLVVHRADCCLEHKNFRDLAQYLRPGDCLVLNETRVFPARLSAWNDVSGAEIEVFLTRPITDAQWEVLVRPGRKARSGAILRFSPQPQEGELKAEVLSATADGGRLIEFKDPAAKPGEVGTAVSRLIETRGKTPLPPYIRRPPREEDVERYQTVYAKQSGSVAAPTAGLHFTGELLEQLKLKGINIVKLVLHVGIGTFRPVRVERVEEHRMHAEYFELSVESADMLNTARQKGGRIVAVGTTAARVLESRAEYSCIEQGSGWTDIFIYPGYRFRAVDALITNFHLPRSTLLMLVHAFAGRELAVEAYRQAVEMRYRFFSYGDAMLII